MFGGNDIDDDEREQAELRNRIRQLEHEKKERDERIKSLLDEIEMHKRDHDGLLDEWDDALSLSDKGQPVREVPNVGPMCGPKFGPNVGPSSGT